MYGVCDRETFSFSKRILLVGVRLRLKCDGTRAVTRFLLSAKRTSRFKSAGTSVQSTTGSRDVRISGINGSNAGYTIFQGSVKITGYLLHSPVSPSLPLPASPCANTFQLDCTYTRVIYIIRGIRLPCKFRKDSKSFA